MSTADKTLGGIIAVLVFLLPFVDSERLFYGAVNAKAFFILALISIAVVYFCYRLWTRRDTLVFRKRWLLYGLMLGLGVQYLSSFLGVYSVGSLWSDILRSTGVFFLTYVAFLAFVSGEILTDRDWRLVRWAVALSGGLFAAISFFGRDGLGLTGRFLTVNLDASGLGLGNTTFAGALLVLTFVITLIELFRSEGARARWVLGALALLQAISPFVFADALWSGTAGLGDIVRNPLLLLGAARSSSAVLWLVVLYMLGFFGIRRFFLGKKTRVVLLLWGVLWVAALVGAVGMLFAPGSFVQERYIEESTAARIILWETGLKAFSERPLFGWGPENFRLADDKYFDNRLGLDENVGEVWFDRAHNVVVDTLVATGVIGLLAGLAILVLFLRTIYQARRLNLVGSTEGQLLAVLPFAHLLQLQTSFDTPTTYVLMALMLGYGLWLERQIYAREKPGERVSRGNRIVAVVLALLVFIGSWNVLALEFSRQRALFRIFTTSDAEEQIESIRRAMSRPGGFEHLRLASSSFIKGFVESVGQTPVENRAAVIATGLEQMELYASRYQEYLGQVPEDYRARMNYAYLLLIQNAFGDDRLDDAREIIDGSYALSPNNQLTYSIDALAKFYGGNVAGARGVIQEGIALNPNVDQPREVSLYMEREIQRIPNIRLLNLENL